MYKLWLSAEMFRRALVNSCGQFTRILVRRQDTCSVDWTHGNKNCPERRPTVCTTAGNQLCYDKYSLNVIVIGLPVREWICFLWMVVIKNEWIWRDTRCLLCTPRHPAPIYCLKLFNHFWKALEMKNSAMFLQKVIFCAM